MVSHTWTFYNLLTYLISLGDKDLLIKQKLILDVLRNVYATWTTDEKDKDFARLVEGEVNYKVPS